MASLVRVVPKRNPIPAPPMPPRRLELWFVVQRGDALWTQVTGSPSYVDRSIIETSARIRGFGGAYRAQRGNQLVYIR